jgi:hypothetical protein
MVNENPFGRDFDTHLGFEKTSRSASNASGKDTCKFISGDGIESMETDPESD